MRRCGRSPSTPCVATQEKQFQGGRGEALSIGLCCALVAQGFEDGVLLAVNHGGDSGNAASTSSLSWRVGTGSKT